MMKLLVGAVVGVVALAIASTTSVVAHEGHEHKLMGTVTMAAVDHVMMKDKEGRDVTVKVTKETTVKAKAPMKVSDIPAGTRVVVTATEGKDKSMMAKSIEVGVTATESK